jgi:hypothetical protein
MEQGEFGFGTAWGVLVQFWSFAEIDTISAEFNWDGGLFQATLEVCVESILVRPEKDDFVANEPPSWQTAFGGGISINGKPAPLAFQVCAGRVTKGGWMFNPPIPADPGLKWQANEKILSPANPPIGSPWLFIQVGFIQEAAMMECTVTYGGTTYTPNLPIGPTFTDVRLGDSLPWYTSDLKGPGLRTGTNGVIKSEDSPIVTLPVDPAFTNSIDFTEGFRLDVASSTVAADYYNRPLYGSYDPGAIYAIWGQDRADATYQRQQVSIWYFRVIGDLTFPDGRFGEVVFTPDPNQAAFGVYPPPTSWELLTGPYEELITAETFNQVLMGMNTWKKS